MSSEEEEEEFYKLLPANKADHLCRRVQRQFDDIVWGSGFHCLQQAQQHTTMKHARVSLEPQLCRRGPKKESQLNPNFAEDGQKRVLIGPQFCRRGPEANGVDRKP